MQNDVGLNAGPVCKVECDSVWFIMLFIASIRHAGAVAGFVFNYAPDPPGWRARTQHTHVCA